jgi:hypothetical protein
MRQVNKARRGSSWSKCSCQATKANVLNWSGQGSIVSNGPVSTLSGHTQVALTDPSGSPHSWRREARWARSRTSPTRSSRTRGRGRRIRRSLSGSRSPASRQPEIHRHILTIAPRRGVTDAVDTIRVKHVSGGVSTSGYKSFDQGREKFQGTAFVAPLLPTGE